MTKANNKNKALIKEILLEDLSVLAEYIKTNEVNSYFLIVNSTPTEYFIADNYLNSPSTLIANLELTLLELKLRFALAALNDRLSNDERQSDKHLPDITDILKNFNDPTNKGNGTLQ